MARYGAIYIAHNPSDGENLFKVGKTERCVKERMAELTADTSNIGTYTAMAIFVVTDVDAAEKACHQRLRRYRVQPNREFFDLELDRLVQAVEEETKPFSASDLIPQPSKAKTPRFREKSALEKIDSLKQRYTEAEANFRESARAAEIELEKNFSIIREKVRLIRDELSNLDFLTWNLPSTFEKIKEVKGRRYICSVMFHSKFSKEPPILKISGLRGGIYGKPDLSRAVEEPTVIHSSFAEVNDFEIVEWKEKDDGRYGRIDINCYVEKNPGSGLISLIFNVRTDSIKYDDYHNSWEDHFHEKKFSNMEEALEVFEELIVVNAARPAIDVRSLGEMKTTRGGKTFQKIHDRGYNFFKATLPEE